MSDLDVADILSKLNILKEKREYHTPLLTDDDGNNYVITNIYVDEDDDVRMDITYL